MIIYNSEQDFNTQMARICAPSPVLNKYLPRTMSNDTQAQFERYLHKAMGYRADQGEY